MVDSTQALRPCVLVPALTSGTVTISVFSRWYLRSLPSTWIIGNTLQSICPDPCSLGQDPGGGGMGSRGLPGFACFCLSFQHRGEVTGLWSSLLFLRVHKSAGYFIPSQYILLCEWIKGSLLAQMRNTNPSLSPLNQGQGKPSSRKQCPSRGVRERCQCVERWVRLYLTQAEETFYVCLGGKGGQLAVPWVWYTVGTLVSIRWLWNWCLWKEKHHTLAYKYISFPYQMFPALLMNNILQYGPHGFVCIFIFCLRFLISLRWVLASFLFQYRVGWYHVSLRPGLTLFTSDF